MPFNTSVYTNILLRFLLFFPPNVKLKDGKITKDELYKRLQELQKASAPQPQSTSNNKVTSAPAPEPQPAPVSSSTSSVLPTAAFSAAIAGAQAQLQRTVSAPNADPAQAALLQQQMQQAIVVAAMALMPTLTGGVPGGVGTSLPPSLPATTTTKSSSTPAAPPMPPPSTSSAVRPTRRQSLGATGGRRNADGTIVSVGGSPTNLAGTGFPGQERKSARKSLVGKGELDECTFRPKITPLPSQYSNSTVAYRQIESLAASRGFEGSAASVPFNDRVSAWEKAKREELVKAAEERAKKELEECTFTPKLSATSREVAKARGGGNNDQVDIHERLFRESFVGGNNGHSAIAARQFSGSASFAAQDAALNESSTLRGRDSAVRAVGMLSTGRPLYPGIEMSGTPVAAMSGHQHAGLDSIEQKQLAECTFQPKVNTVLDARPVRSRYRDPTPTRGRGTSETPSADGRPPPPLPSGVAECTFMPQTNNVRPQTMPAAAVYVQVPIFERLSKTQTASQREREREVQEDQQRVLETQAALEAPIQPSLPSTARDPKLQEFLSRQEAAAAKKEADIEAQRQLNAPTLQPALCEKSLRIVRAKGSGRFLDRVVHESIAKEHDQMRTQAMLGNDPECTFAPAINPSSRAMRPRSVVDMSRGDALKRETAARLLRLKLEQEDLQGITFKPAINERSRHTEGRLRILSEPESYVARVKAVQATQVDRIRRQMQQAEATELAECTFTPAVHSAPEYVSRIAQSMALARSVKQLAPPARPDWR